MSKTFILILITVLFAVFQISAATLLSDGIPDDGLLFGESSSGYYSAVKVDTNGYQYIADFSGGDIDTVSVVDTVNTITECANVTSVDTVDAVTECANVTSVDTVDAVTEVANVTSVDTVDTVTECANVTSLDTVDEVTNVTSLDTVDEVTNVTSLDTVDEVTNVTSVDTVDTVTTVGTVSSITAGNIDIDYSTEGFITEVERGNISGVSLIEISSFHTELSSSFELVSASNSPEVMLTTAEAVNISSSSATDDKDSTGAKSLTIYGSNAAGARISETLNLEGQTTQETTLSFYCIDNIEVATVGSGGAQVGDIYVFEADAPASAGVPDGNPLAKIPIGYGACGNGKFMVPTGDEAVLVDLSVFCNGTGPYELIGMVKAYGSDEPARMFCDVMLDDGAQCVKLNKNFAENSYVYFLAKSANAGDDISIRARFLLY